MAKFLKERSKALDAVDNPTIATVNIMEDSDIMSDEFVYEKTHSSIKLAKRTKDTVKIPDDQVAPEPEIEDCIDFSSRAPLKAAKRRCKAGFTVVDEAKDAIGIDKEFYKQRFLDKLKLPGG